MPTMQRIISKHIAPTTPPMMAGVMLFETVVAEDERTVLPPGVVIVMPGPVGVEELVPFWTSSL